MSVHGSWTHHGQRRVCLVGRSDDVHRSGGEHMGGATVGVQSDVLATDVVDVVVDVDVVDDSRATHTDKTEKKRRGR